MTNEVSGTDRGVIAPVGAAGRYSRYPGYKYSGVVWLGEIPLHWKIRRLRYSVTKCQNGLWGDEPEDLNSVACIRVADFDRVNFKVETREPTLRSVGPTIMNERALRAGDLLLEKSGGGDNQPVGAVVQSTYEEPAICSNFVARMPVKEGFQPRYLTYFHAALYSARVNTRSIKQSTGIQNLDSDSYLNEIIVFPELLEQRDIVKFLDRETAKIDALVAKKERLVELSQEKRTALITRAVTKGLDPDVPMKESGVEWLGEIPAHWKCLAIARATLSRCDGPFGSGLKSQHYSADGVRVVRLQNIGRPEFLDSDQVFIDDTHANSLGDHSVFEGDLLIAGLGDDAHPVGRACVAPGGLGRAIVKADCFRFRLRWESAFPQFVAYQLSAVASAASGYFVTGSTRLRMNLTTTAARKIALPSIMEQSAIADHLDRETAKIDALVAKVREAIDRLKELRTALISEAVTGKIDVREAAV